MHNRIDVQNDPVNWIDPWGLYTGILPHTHEHDKTNPEKGHHDDFATTYSTNGDFDKLIYWSSFDKLSEIEQDMVDWHEMLHAYGDYGPNEECTVLQKENEYAERTLGRMKPTDPNSDTLKLWIKRLENLITMKKINGECDCPKNE